MLRTLGWPVITAVTVLVVVVTSTTVALVSSSSSRRIIAASTSPAPASMDRSGTPAAAATSQADSAAAISQSVPAPVTGASSVRPRARNAAAPVATADWVKTLDVVAVLTSFYTPDTAPQVLYRSDLAATASRPAVVIVAATVGKSTRPYNGGVISTPRTLIAAITRSSTGTVFLASDFVLFSHFATYPVDLNGTLSSYAPTATGVKVAYTSDSTALPAGAPSGTTNGRGDFTLELTWNGQQLAGRPVEVTRPCTQSDYPRAGDPKSVAASMAKGLYDNLWISIPAPLTPCWIQAGPITLTGTAADGTTKTWTGPTPSYHLDAAYPSGGDYVRLDNADLECEGTAVTQYTLQLPLGLTFSFSGTCNFDGILEVGAGASRS